MITVTHIDDLSVDSVVEQLSFTDGLPVAIGYIRTSVKESPDYTSKACQCYGILEACRRIFPDGHHVVFVYDHGVAGLARLDQESLASRAGLNLIVQLIRRRLIRHVCTFSFTRISRSSVVVLDMARFLASCEVNFFAATEPRRIEQAFAGDNCLRLLSTRQPCLTDQLVNR